MKKYIIILFVFLNTNLIYSQIDEGKIKATVFNIPASSAFVLLGTNPTNVIRPGFTKDLKIDYILKEGKLVSDLALDVKPLWLFIFDEYSLEDYRRSTSFARTLSTLNVSLGTAEKDGLKKFAWAMTMTLVRTDPMYDIDYQESLNKVLEISDQESDFRFSLMSKIAKLNRRIEELEGNPDPDAVILKIELEKERDNYQKALEGYTELRQELKSKELKEVNHKYLNEHLGDPMLQIGYGNVYNYDNPSLDSLRFENSGWGIWFQGSWGFNLFDLLFANNKSNEHQITLSGMGRYLKINSLKSQFYGFNICYGSSKANLFGEFSYEKTGKEEAYTIAYGGELRIDATKSILFGIKNCYTDKFNTKRLIPAVKINWILAGNPF